MKRDDMFQPRCSVAVCRSICPYSRFPFKVSITRLNNGNDAVCLCREHEDGSYIGCIVMYINGKCENGDREIESDPFGFMRRHAPRIMDECPLKTEHILGQWSRRRTD